MLNNFKNVDGEEEALFRGQMVAEVLEYIRPNDAIDQHCIKKESLSYLDIAKKSENVYSPYPSNDGVSKPIFNQLLDSGWKHNKLSYLDIGKSLGSYFSSLPSDHGAYKLYKTQFCGVPELGSLMFSP